MTKIRVEQLTSGSATSGLVLTSAGSGIAQWKPAVGGSGTSGSQVVPLGHVPVSNFYLTGYDDTTGSFASGSVVGGASGSHNDLSGLQGGTGGQYYHLTSAERTIAIQASGSGQAGYLSSADWNRFNATSGSAGISDAPSDGKQYGRKDATWTEIISGSGTSSGSQVVPLNHPAVAGEAITGYSNVTGSMTSGSVVTDHVQLANIGTATHANIDSALTRLLYTSGSNTGNQIVPVTASPITSFYLTGYDSASGSWTSGSVVGGTAGSQVVPIDHVPVSNFFLTGYNAASGSFSSGSSASGSSGGGAHDLYVLGASGSSLLTEGFDRDRQTASAYAYAGCRFTANSIYTTLTQILIDIDIATSSYTWTITPVGGSAVASGSFSGSGADIPLTLSPPLVAQPGRLYDLTVNAAPNAKFGDNNLDTPQYLGAWTIYHDFYGSATPTTTFTFPIKFVYTAYDWQIVKI